MRSAPLSTDFAMSQTTCFMTHSRLTLLIAAILVGTHGIAEEAPAIPPLEFFERQVRPLLSEHCYSCHSVDSKKLQAGLMVDSRNALVRGGDSGGAIVPGDVDGSLLIEAVRYESYEMPPKGKLSAGEIHVLERWVEMGAPGRMRRPQVPMRRVRHSICTSERPSTGSGNRFDRRQCPP